MFIDFFPSTRTLLSGIGISHSRFGSNGMSAKCSPRAFIMNSQQAVVHHSYPFVQCDRNWTRDDKMMVIRSWRISVSHGNLFFVLGPLCGRRSVASTGSAGAQSKHNSKNWGLLGRYAVSLYFLYLPAQSSEQEPSLRKSVTVWDSNGIWIRALRA